MQLMLVCSLALRWNGDKLVYCFELKIENFLYTSMHGGLAEPFLTYREFKYTLMLISYII